MKKISKALKKVLLEKQKCSEFWVQRDSRWGGNLPVIRCDAKATRINWGSGCPIPKCDAHFKTRKQLKSARLHFNRSHMDVA